MPPAQTIKSGENFAVKVSVTPDTAIAGMQLSLMFDGAVIKADKVTEGNLFKQSGVNTLFNSGKIDNAAGSLRSVYGCIMGKKTVSTPGIFAVISLTLSKDSNIRGPHLLRLAKIKICNAAGDAVPVTVKNGIVKTPPAPTLVVIAKKRGSVLAGIAVIGMILFGIAWLYKRGKRQ